MSVQAEQIKSVIALNYVATDAVRSVYNLAHKFEWYVKVVLKVQFSLNCSGYTWRSLSLQTLGKWGYRFAGTLFAISGSRYASQDSGEKQD